MSALTVKQLRKALRGVPEDALIVIQDHDHSEKEWNGHASSAGHAKQGDDLYESYNEQYGSNTDIFWLHV